MKTSRVITFFVSCLIIFSGCETHNESHKDILQQNKLSVNTERIGLHNTLSSKIIEDRANYSIERIRDINNVLHFADPDNSVVALLEASCESEPVMTATKVTSVGYATYPVTVDNKIIGYLWNFYGSTKRSIFQEFKFDKLGKVIGFSLWNDENKFFLSTNDELYKPQSSALIYNNPAPKLLKETYEECVVRVYGAAKAACEADPTCDMMCDFTPGCHACMAVAAAAACALN
ncbi:MULTISPECIES: hypothetical protein [Sphingobacterium]|uniref:hypothetical protein n=2 Tax=Sphingobacteriaceae TaxID=84566 RepID=UPI000FBF4D63|nr:MULTISPECIES: hypothetical protein [Sphingobacterium]MBB1643036.1 hypothetical protein [Sphingobacterium sp. UME9]QQT32826.1 hypothetical protein I6I99_09800 [Sphingobacterium multivorum]